MTMPATTDGKLKEQRETVFIIYEDRGDYDTFSRSAVAAYKTREGAQKALKDYRADSLFAEVNKGLFDKVADEFQNLFEEKYDTDELTDEEYDKYDWNTSFHNFLNYVENFNYPSKKKMLEFDDNELKIAYEYMSTYEPMPSYGMCEVELKS